MACGAAWAVQEREHLFARNCSKVWHPVCEIDFLAWVWDGELG